MSHWQIIFLPQFSLGDMIIPDWEEEHTKSYVTCTGCHNYLSPFKLAKLYKNFVHKFCRQHLKPTGPSTGPSSIPYKYVGFENSKEW